MNRTFEDCVDVDHKCYDMKWEAEYVPAFKSDGYIPSNWEGYEIDIQSIRHSFMNVWLELPEVPKPLFDEMIEDMHKIMAKSLED